MSRERVVWKPVLNDVQSSMLLFGETNVGLSADAYTVVSLVSILPLLCNVGNPGATDNGRGIPGCNTESLSCQHTECLKVPRNQASQPNSPFPWPP